MEELQMLDLNNYKTIKDLSASYGSLFTEGSIRQMIHRNTNGINECIFRIGSKILINVSKFEQWFKERENN